MRRDPDAWKERAERAREHLLDRFCRDDRDKNDGTGEVDCEGCPVAAALSDDPPEVER